MRYGIFIVLISCMMAFSACGLSSEEASLQTASALTAQVEQWTGTPSPTLTATPTSTPSPSPTSTSTLTPIPEWTPDYQSAFIDSREITLGDVLPNADSNLRDQKLFDLKLITDESFLIVCSNKRVVMFNENFRASQTEDKAGAAQSMARVILKGLFLNAIHYNNDVRDLKSSLGHEAAFEKFILDFSQGDAFSIKANLAGGEDYLLEKIKIGLPAEIQLVFYGNRNWRIKGVEPEKAYGINITLDGKIMILYTGLNYPGFLLPGRGLSENAVSSIFYAMSLPYNQGAIDIVENGGTYNENSALVCRKQ